MPTISDMSFYSLYFLIHKLIPSKAAWIQRSKRQSCSLSNARWWCDQKPVTFDFFSLRLLGFCFFFFGYRNENLWRNDGTSGLVHNEHIRYEYSSRVFCVFFLSLLFFCFSSAPHQSWIISYHWIGLWRGYFFFHFTAENVFFLFLEACVVSIVFCRRKNCHIWCFFFRSYLRSCGNIRLLAPISQYFWFLFGLLIGARADALHLFPV